jgi:hypothetical protein
MKSEPVNKNQYSQNLEYSISRFHLIRHIFALILTGGLCLSLVMSELSYHTHSHSHHGPPLSQVIVPYALMLFFVGTIAITTILTACKIKIGPEGVEISNLFWHEKLSNSDLKTFRSPANLKFAWLKTRRVLYLLAKNEFKEWAELEQALLRIIPNQNINRKGQ